MSSILHFSQRTLKLGLKLRANFQNASRNYSKTFKINKQKEIGPLGWFLLVIPSSTFALGTWQVQRKRWKESLIAELEKRTNATAVELPQSIDEISELEFYPIHIRGEFDHSKELYIGPRSLLHHGDAVSSSSLFTKQSNTQGYLVITPFKLENRDTTVLVNRGWVSTKNKDPATRPLGQIKGVIDLVGVVRLHENRPQFVPANKPLANVWFYRDLNQMCDVTGADPIFLDAVDTCDVKGGPIGGQTRIALRNEHLSYIITWFSLSAMTGFMWFSYFIKGVKL
ncbi:hypothetical protein PPYR_05599 [Photinus pyralis]|uniref:SURF1-like protein n=1 Tax=Photinus pyralis TaxID=7054 RepID=A0A1Y1LD18_PHOPY|nr:surfeit locus protein 1 [Photinus pyralis]KAB0801245.1 hypothetical protein PPYR_05599 [Photinus pyralis]